MGFNKSMFGKILPEDLRDYLRFKRRGSRVRPKKGKGSYDRNTFRNRRG